MQNNYHYGLIGNGTSAALVSQDASIDWLCLPFLILPLYLGAFWIGIGGDTFKSAGWRRPRSSNVMSKDTAVLKTVFETACGSFEVNDYMPRFALGQGEYYCP
jgi:hypothetical protein